MPHAIQIRQAGGPEVLNWAPVDVGEPGPGQVRLRQVAAGLNYIEGAGTIEAVAQDVRGLKVGDRVAYAGPIDPIAPVVLSQKGSLFLTRPFLFHCIEQREALETCANDLFDVMASGKVRINVNQRFALKDAAGAHRALEARATSGSAILTT